MSEFGDLGGVHVMDLYAGSGALGLEALSRGAASVLLVESDARAAAIVKANVDAVGLPGATVAADRVERLLARTPGERGHQHDNGYDLVFADPPYAVTDEAVATGAHPPRRRLACRWRARRGGAGHEVGAV